MLEALFFSLCGFHEQENALSSILSLGNMEEQRLLFFIRFKDKCFHLAFIFSSTCFKNFFFFCFLKVPPVESFLIFNFQSTFLFLSFYLVLLSERQNLLHFSTFQKMLQNLPFKRVLATNCVLLRIFSMFLVLLSAFPQKEILLKQSLVPPLECSPPLESQAQLLLVLLLALPLEVALLLH